MVGGSVRSVRISRFDEWALTIARTYPVVAGDADPQAPTAPTFPTLDGPARQMVTALRLVCGGSVVTTRPMLAQSDDEFPIVPSYTAIHSAFDSADNERPTLLMTDALDQGSVRPAGDPAVAGPRGGRSAGDDALVLFVADIGSAGSCRRFVSRVFDMRRPGQLRPCPERSSSRPDPGRPTIAVSPHPLCFAT